MPLPADLAPTVRRSELDEVQLLSGAPRASSHLVMTPPLQGDLGEFNPHGAHCTAVV